MKSVLVTGGAGYIGSHAVKALVQDGHRVVVADNLFRGYRQAVHPAAKFYECDLLDRRAIEEVLNQNQIEVVLHFAGLAQVAESVSDPLRYYAVNCSGTLALLEAMRHQGVDRLVFSSTCAVYGSPSESQVTEQTPTRPLSPYGRSKLAAEKAVADLAESDPSFRYFAFRYFNVAGCATDGSIGEETVPQTRLIPSLIAATLKRRPPVSIHGTDYATPDGTCIRDYVHVEDLVQAHLDAMEAMDSGGGGVVNLGSGCGYSVMEVIEAVERVSGRRVPTQVGARRAGDTDAVWADFAKAKNLLNWRPELGLQRMVETAWRWFRDHPHGYRRLPFDNGSPEKRWTFASRSTSSVEGEPR